ncbi:MAG: hypothetical protein JNK02_16405, partial [Planctomycetes bacterium]|nr:hypothetical protein [Planctomycetota bacterium]
MSHARSSRRVAVRAACVLGPGLLLAGCGGSSNSASQAGSMDLVQVSNGFGQVLPHKVYRLNANGTAST